MTEQEKKINKFIEEFDFEKNLIFYWLPWRGKTEIMRKLFLRIDDSESKLIKYWIDDWNFREKITSWIMKLRDETEWAISMTKYPLEMCINSKILFYDDLWASENVSEAQKTKLKFILDERERKWLVTILSTNLTPKELSDLYWERIKSRIFNGKHKKGLLMLEITWEDRRKENIEKLLF